MPENAGYVWMVAVFREKSLRFRKYPATCGRGLRPTCGRNLFLNTEEKISVFENTRLRVDEALIKGYFRHHLDQNVVCASDSVKFI